MTSDWYKTLFPKSQIANEQSSATDFKTHSHGGRFTTSVDGTITGRGGNLIVIDDPINTSNTTSETALNKVNEWYKKTLLSRLDNQETDSIVLMMQRVHENDLTGYLLENEPDKWDVIKIPQIAIENETWVVGNKTFIRAKGQVLNPDYTGLEKSLELKQSLGSYVWESQYQQNPIAVESGIIKPEWLHYEDKVTFDRNEVCNVYLSWDTASKTGTDNAYSACVVIVMTRDRKLHLVEVYRDKWEIPDLIKETKDIYNQWASNLGNRGQITLLVEEASSGVALNQFLVAEYNNGGSYFNTVAIKPHGDKASRLINSSVVIESGRLLFPSESRNLDWWPEFKKELLGFPGTKYKDQVDALSQVIRYILDEESQ
jgi:predicted phage terminase large subunit-like protein